MSQKFGNGSIRVRTTNVLGLVHVSDTCLQVVMQKEFICVLQNTPVLGKTPST